MKVERGFVPVGIVLVTLVYLGFELAFNIRLVDVAGGLPGRNEIDDLELQGRLLSATGASLLTLRLLAWLFARLPVTRPRLGALAGALCIAVLVFFGQKAAVDYLANSASPTEKRRAALAVLLAKGMKHCVAGIPELDLDCKAASAAEGKTFFVVLPAIAYASGSLTDSLNPKAAELVTTVVLAEAGSPERAYNERYVYSVNQLRDRFNRDYLAASRTLSGLPGDDADRSWNDYLQEINKHPFTPATATDMQRRRVIEALRKRGVDVPDHWRLDDRETFVDSLPQGRALRQFRARADAILGGRTSIAPGLDWALFSSHADVQGFVKRQIASGGSGFELPAGPIDLTLSFNAFKKQIFGPPVERRVREASEKVRLSSESYAPGGRNHQAGIDAIRAVIVPPIALGMSLLFALVNLGAILVGWTPLSARARGVLRMGIVACVLGLPLLLSNRITTSRAFERMSHGLEQRMPPAALLVNWVVRAEPVFYHVLAPAVAMVPTGLVYGTVETWMNSITHIRLTPSAHAAEKR
ncbi:hypothetical protein [Roseateles violae]|uniref:Uncharacterized protein n=1 Tax=Roseateles violae TaxID=3058042 RepID=A0ABT8DPF8_9BURK|nr:hypothetical protein [Pelomonas sp. PFR6]MDN3920047.1 hypothetical protein [Pelomonas sp. PFR6]